MKNAILGFIGTILLGFVGLNLYGVIGEARLLWRGQMSFRLLLHAVLLYTILMCIIKIRSDLFRITVYLEP